MNRLLIISVLAIILHSAGVSTQKGVGKGELFFTDEECEERGRICEQAYADATQMLDNFDCGRTTYDNLISKTATCNTPGCPEAKEKLQISKLAREFDRKMHSEGCAAGLTMPRDCDFSGSFKCASQSAGLVFVIIGFQIQDLKKLCVDIHTLLDAVNICQMCVQGLIPNWQSWSATVDYVFNVSITMINGGCNCTRLIAKAVEEIDTATTCATVATVTTFSRIIGSDCTIKLINYPLQLDWLEIVNNYIVFFTVYIERICGLIAGGAGAAAISSSLGLILFTTMLLFVRRITRV